VSGVQSFGSGLVSRLRTWAIVNRLGIATVVKNISWLTAENFATTLIAAIVSIVVARTLGPSAAGTWGYVFAIYSVSLLVTTLGTDQILIIDLVATRHKREIVISTALALRLTASILVALALIAGSFTIGTQTPEQNELIRVLALSLIAMSFDVVGIWFRAQLRFDRVVVPSMLAAAVGGAAKIYLVIHEHSIMPLGYLTVGQSALMQGIIVWSAYRGGLGMARGGFSARYAWELLRSSVPLMISGLAVFVYLRANVFFINEFEGKVDVGIYNAAAAISGIAYFIPTVMVTALTPSLYRLYNADEARFERSFRHITTLLTLGLSMIAFAVTLLSRRIILLLYGAAFLPAAPVLALHVWTLIAVAYGLTSSVWLAAEKRTSVLMLRTVGGGVVNVALNLLLIPRLGIIGAAIATLVAMFIASMFILPLFGRTARRIFVIQLRSMFLIDVVAMLVAARHPRHLPKRRKREP
jgi:O-antigen/teichoic acid export membrane protein